MAGFATFGGPAAGKLQAALYYARQDRRARAIANYIPPPPFIQPSSSWNGTAGTGFAVTPTDPTRTTAKPALRLAVPPHQFFTDSLLVGVRAEALNVDTLLGGVDRVELFWEGSVVTISQPTLQPFTRPDGSTYLCAGYWAVLEWTANGNGHFYARAWPADATMQPRVIGPFLFFPQRYSDGAGGFTPFDYRVTVNSAATPVTGSVFASFASARNWLRTAPARNPLITFANAADNLPTDAGGSDWNPDGYVNIAASVPITFGHRTFAERGDIRPRSPLRVIGPNITFDMAHTGQILIPPVAGGREHWLDRVHFTNSLGRDSYWEEGDIRAAQLTVGGSPWFTECRFTQSYEPVASAALTRACTFETVTGDVLRFNRLSIGCVINDSDSTFFNTAIAALSVVYTGAATTATIEGSGTTATKTFTLRENGTSIGTFQARTGGADYLAGTNYFVRNVRDWINSFPGWSATVLDETRVAAQLSTQTGRGLAFGAQNCKTTPLTLFTASDIHADTISGNGENRIVADLLAWNLVGQNLFLSDGPSTDYIVVNAVLVNKEVGGWESALSQVGNSVASHVVIANVTMPNQRFSARSLATFDTYCAVLSSTFQSIAREGTNTNLKIIGNHVQDGGGTPLAATEHTIGGTRATLFVSALTGDVRPVGELVVNPKTNRLRFDLVGHKRGATAPAGALA